ncbi:MAG: hypothetical protein ABIA59_11030 [Candidatus Latescibacterota bacterium]
MRSGTIGFALILFAIFAAVSMLHCSQLLAQTGDISRLEDEIRRNAELITEAERLVAETNSTKARASLQTAILLHKESIHLATTSQPLLAARAVQKAREAVLRTIALAKMEAKTEETAKRSIERANRRLETAKNLLDNSPALETGAADKLIDEARVQLHRALDNMREHLFSSALQLANSSEKLSNQAISILKNNHTRSSDVERELAKTDRVLKRIDSYEDIADYPPAEKRYREALELQTRAKNHFRSGHAKRAVEFTQRARNIALSVAKILSSNPNAENTDNAIQLTDGLLERADEIAREADSNPAVQKLSSALELQDQAKSHFTNKQYSQALRLTLRARELAKEAIGAVDKPLAAEEVEAAIRATDSVINRLKEQMNQSADQADRELFERLVAHQNSAWREFEKGSLRAALARTKLARNLARRILERINEGRL